MSTDLRQEFDKATDNAQKITPERFKSAIEAEDLADIAFQLGYYAKNAKKDEMLLYDDY